MCIDSSGETSDGAVRRRRRSVARPWLSPLNQRRWQNFKANRRGYWSLWIFLVLFVLSLFSELIANDRPILASYKGEILFPVAGRLSGRKVRRLLCRHRLSRPGHPGRDQRQWLDDLAADPLLLPTVNNAIPEAAPAKPSWLYDKKTRCNQYPQGADDPNCIVGNWNWLGTDDQARDVLARVIYGFRISVLFGLILTARLGADRRRGRRRAGLFRRLDRPSVPALHRNLVGDPGALSAADRRRHPAARLLHPARADAVVFLGGAGRRGAGRIPARPQLRICQRGARARRAQPHHHVPPPAAQRHGGDADLPALPASAARSRR